MNLPFFSRRRRSASQPVGAMSEGRRVYAIGDIHGRLDLLDGLLARIEQDDAARGAADTHVIFLGDLIDRGPQSAQVVARAIELSQCGPNIRFLLGNHEEVFLQALEGDLKALAFFTRIGGRETILSYGISEKAYLESDYRELYDLWRPLVPDAHIAFVRGFEDLIIMGDYAFVHAGVRPSEPLARQKASDLRWIRGEFLSHAAPLEKVIVHGHTISEEIEFASHRIGLDTGAYASGKLTAMGFEGNERWAIESRDDASV